VRRIVFACLSAACLGVGLLGWQAAPVVATPAITADVIRFHVVANSDSPRDQAAKLLVRDRLMEVLAPALADVTVPAKARSWIREHRKLLVAQADAALREAGLAYGARVDLGWASFPAKTMGDLTLPGGVYPALTVVLGAGRGQNWWCVVFPPLCLADREAAASWNEPPSGPEALVVGAPLTGGRSVRLGWFLPQLLRGIGAFLGHRL
jgi:stage II sporulation protein R